jgi:hypothetical protein
MSRPNWLKVAAEQNYRQRRSLDRKHYIGEMKTLENYVTIFGGETVHL